LRGDLKTEYGSEITAVQDQTLQTKLYATKIFRNRSKFRLWQQFDETVEHVISACLMMAQEKHVKRRDNVGAQLHLKMCKAIWVKSDK